jgi:ATP-dependent Clp protease ATP-binding subunit ClpC
MSDKLDRFSKRARKVLTMAQEEAQRLNHNYIGTEHLLLGLVKEDQGVAVKVLRELGVEPMQVVKAIERAVGKGDRPPYGKPTLAPRTKRVIELSVEEARLMGHQYIGTEHLLLGLVREGEGIAVNVLRSLGVSLDKVRTATAKSLLESEQTQERKKQESKTPLIDQLGLDLTQQAEENKLDPVIGREKEIERVIQILSRRTKNNPALIGEPGVGKTAIVEGWPSASSPATPGDAAGQAGADAGCGLAGSRHHVPRPVRGAAQEGDRGDQGQRRDPLHRRGAHAGGRRLGRQRGGRGQHPQAGPGPGRAAVHRRHHAGRVPQAISRGDASLERRFQPVLVEEPTIEDTIEILQGIRGVYEEHHKLEITDEALVQQPISRPALRGRPLPARQGHRPGGRGRQPGAHVQVALRPAACVRPSSA